MKGIKNRIMRKTAVLLAFLVLFCAVAREISVMAAAPAATVTSKTIYVGTGYQIRFKNLAKTATVTYKSSNTKAAKVSKTGFVTPVAKGKATVTITIKQNSKTFTNKITFTVKKPYISIPNKKTTLVKGSDYLLLGKAYGIAGANLSFSSSNILAATVDKKTGMVHARGEGPEPCTTVITLKDSTSGKSVSFTLLVEKKTAKNAMNVYLSTQDFPNDDVYEAPENLEGMAPGRIEMINYLADIQRRITLKRSITVQEMTDYYMYKDMY